MSSDIKNNSCRFYLFSLMLRNGGELFGLQWEIEIEIEKWQSNENKPRVLLDALVHEHLTLCLTFTDKSGNFQIVPRISIDQLRFYFCLSFYNDIKKLFIISSSNQSNVVRNKYANEEMLNY